MLRGNSSAVFRVQRPAETCYFFLTERTRWLFVQGVILTKFLFGEEIAVLGVHQMRTSLAPFGDVLCPVFEEFLRFSLTERDL